MTAVAYIPLTIAAALALARALRPGSLANRAVGIDLLVTVIVMGIAVQAAIRGDGVYLDLVVIVSLVGFIATATVARFIEQRGSQ